jgi:hypothetical protein
MTHISGLDGHGPRAPLSENRIHQKGGQVANGRVLDSRGLLPHVVHVPENRNLLPGRLHLLDSLLSNVELPFSGESEATTKFLKSEDMQIMIQSKTYSGVSTVNGKVVMEGWDELHGGTLVGVLVQSCKDVHSGISYQRVEVAAEALAREEIVASPLRQEHLAFGQILVLLVEVALETVPLPTRLLVRVGVAARATSTTSLVHMEKLSSADFFHIKSIGMRFL